MNMPSSIDDSGRVVHNVPHLAMRATNMPPSSTAFANFGY